MSVLCPRGPLGSVLTGALGGPAHELPAIADAAKALAADVGDALADDDFQHCLYLLYELHFGTHEVDPEWEWCPDLLAARGHLERRFERDLRERFPSPGPSVSTPAVAKTHVAETLFDLAATHSGESLAGFVARRADRRQVAELLVLRSPYQLKEADPHTLAIPRLRGSVKAALVEIQADEYGGGITDRMHQRLFARSMSALGLDPARNHYLDHVPAPWLASVNALSMFALNGRLRGALCGHLAIFEMSSSLPAKRYVTGLQRLGLGRDACEFFDEHIEADAVHEQIAAQELCAGLVRQEPELLQDVLFGASVCHGMDQHVGAATLTAWKDGRSALRTPLTSTKSPRTAPRG